MSIGAQALTKKAMEISGIADRMFVIGDCDSAGNVRKAMRSAFGIAVSRAVLVCRSSLDDPQTFASQSAHILSRMSSDEPSSSELYASRWI